MSASSAARSIIFVPGAWHKSSTYDPTLAQLKNNGYPGRLIPIELPSVDAPPDSPALWSMLPDVQAVEKAIAAEIDAGHSVLLVAHSYGGIPSSCALKKFADSGKVKYVVLAGFMLEFGESLIALAGGVPPPLWKREVDPFQRTATSHLELLLMFCIRATMSGQALEKSFTTMCQKTLSRNSWLRSSLIHMCK